MPQGRYSIADLDDAQLPGAPLGTDRASVIARARQRREAEDRLDSISPPRPDEIGPGNYARFGHQPAASGRYRLENLTDTPAAAASTAAPDRSYGVRPDGTEKGDGFLGPLERPDGTGVMSEYSIADSEQLKDAHGKYLDYPTLVPTLTPSEVQTVLTTQPGQPLPETIKAKAEAFALARRAGGKPLFAQPGEQRTDLYPQFRRVGGRRAPIAADGFTDPASVRITNPPPPTPSGPAGPQIETFTRGRFTGLPGHEPVRSELADPITGGAQQIVRGAERVAPAFTADTAGTISPPPSPKLDDVLGGASDVLEGGFKLATPAVVAGAMMAPLITATLLAAGAGAQKGTEAGTAALGATPSQARFAGNLAALIAGYGAGKAVHGVTSATVDPTVAARKAAADVLGVSPNSSPDVIQSAYYRLARQHHPDLNPTADPSTIADLNLAYSYLQDHPAAAREPGAIASWAQRQVEWLKSKLQPSATSETSATRPRELGSGAYRAEDVLPTGEVQPRLPNDVGAVRDVERASPTFEAPFSLSPETAETGSVQPSLPTSEAPAGQFAVTDLAPAVAESRPSTPPGGSSATERTESVSPEWVTWKRRVDARSSLVSKQHPEWSVTKITQDAHEFAGPEPDQYVIASAPDDLAGGGQSAADVAVPDTHLRRELRRMVAELDAVPFSKHTFIEKGAGHGGDLEVIPGSAGAAVYTDILQSAPGTSRYTRGQVRAALDKYLETGKVTNPVIGALDVARARYMGALRTSTGHALSRPLLPPDAGDEPGRVYVDRDRSLAPAHTAVQERLASAVEADADRYLARMRERFGTAISTDAARSVLLEDLTPDERLAQNNAAQRPARALAEAARRAALQAPTPPGREAYVLIVAGPTGVGKTSAFRSLPGLDTLETTAAVHLEGTYQRAETAIRHIDEALAAGFKVGFVYVHRDPVPSYVSGVLDRRGDEFRPITPEFHIAAHVNAPQAFGRVLERYQGDPDVEIAAIDNRGAAGTAHLAEERAIARVRYDESNVARQIDHALSAARRAGGERARKADAIESARAGVREARRGDDGNASESRPESGPAGHDRPEDLDHPEDLDARSQSPSGGSREGMAGLFHVDQSARSSRAASIHPIAFPELVSLARELAGTPSVVKAFRTEGKVGEFNSTRGTIRLHADLFKAGNEDQLAATLAHEIGHLIDWLPQRTLKRGNLLGRLFSLRGFLKQTFIVADGDHIRNADIRRELQALSDKWRPWDPDTATPSFKAYRHSGKELFADAMSVLLNNPGMLEAAAPTFYEQFFNALDEKPEVKRAYFDLQELVSGTPEDVIAKRRAGVREMFAFGDTKAIDLERLRQSEWEMSRKDLWLRTRIQHVDKNAPIIDRVKALEKRGVRINPDDDPRYFLEERNYLGGKLKAFTGKHYQPIYADLSAHQIDWHTFGEALFYERIAAGDRSDVANPRGLAPDSARDLLNDVMRTLSPQQRTVLRENMDAFRAVIRRVAEDAHKAGLYSDELYEQLNKNPAYVSFRVIEHLDSEVTSRVYRQIGTLKDIQNPADASMLKTLVTIRAIEHQKVKLATFEFLAEHYPGDIAQAEEITGAKGVTRPIEPKDKGRELITYWERGKLRGKYVDHYIADSLNNASIGQNLVTVQALRWVNSGIFRPVFTTLNLGFQSFNFGRDLLRLWKNTPGMSLARVVKRYAEAAPLARVRAFGLPDNPTFGQRMAHKDLLQAEDSKILSVTFNDLIAGRDVADTQIEDTLSKMGVGGFGPTTKRGPLARPVMAVLDWIEKTGNFIETLPKAAGIYEFKGAGTVAEIPPDKRSHIRRKIGSPDFLAGGTVKPLGNEIFLFSNAITQAIRADFEVAREPSTRAGFWWKTAALNVAPKLLAFAILYSALGDDDDDSAAARLKRAFRGISEYDLTNYLVVPIGVDAKGNTTYLRLPQDDFGRLLGGLTWKGLQGARGDRNSIKTATQIFDYTAGQAPGLSPVFGLMSDTAAFASGRNVYDAYRGRFLFTDDEAKAGGGRALRKFVGYEFQELGGNILWKFYPGEQRPQERTPGQKILELPILSAVVGRWLKISNAGQMERLREVQGQVEQGEARHRLDERAAVNAAIRTYREIDPSQRTPEKLQALARGIVAEAGAGDEPKDRAEMYRRALKKIRMGMVRGGSDALVDAVMAATSADQKVALIVHGADEMSPSDFQTWLVHAMTNQIITPAVRGQVFVALRRAKGAAATPTP